MISVCWVISRNRNEKNLRFIGFVFIPWKLLFGKSQLSRFYCKLCKKVEVGATWGQQGVQRCRQAVNPAGDHLRSGFNHKKHFRWASSRSFDPNDFGLFPTNILVIVVCNQKKGCVSVLWTVYLMEWTRYKDIAASGHRQRHRNLIQRKITKKFVPLLTKLSFSSEKRSNACHWFMRNLRLKWEVKVKQFRPRVD